MKVGLLLEGGAMRGLYTAGVLDVFMEEHVQIDAIVGVSAGALFGMNYKSGQAGRVLRYNMQYAGSRHYMGFYSLLTTGNIMNQSFCFDKLVHELDPIDYATFRENPVEFYAVVTNMETGAAEYIKIEDLEVPEQMEFLRASGSMPFVSRPVVIRGNKYLDGGIADSIPIEKIMGMGYDKVVVVLTRPATYRKEKSGERLPRMYYRGYPRLAQAICDRSDRYNRQVDTVAKLEEEGKVFVFRPSRVVPVRRIEKDKRLLSEMYKLGRGDAAAGLEPLHKFLNS